MATLAPKPPETATRLVWFVQFLKEELAPYPGRVGLVIRMVTAATLVMIMNMTFRIPYSVYGAYYALTISRESPRTTVSVAQTTILAFAAGAGFVLLGSLFFVNYPMLRFLWVVMSFFTMFYALSALSDYLAAARFGYLLVVSIPLWDQQTTAELRVENTLWAVGAIGAATIIATLLELAFAGLSPVDEVIRAISERLECVERLLLSYRANRQLDEPSAKNITRLAMVGTSRVRRILERSAYSTKDRQQMGAVLAISGRLIDIAANLEYVGVPLDDHDRNRVSNLAANIANIRTALLNKTVPAWGGPDVETGVPRAIPLLGEMETTVSLIPRVFAGSRSTNAHPLPSSEKEAPRSFLVPDALTNPEHIHFAMKGCLAASLCYVTYNALFWPGISTAVTTCLLTALTTIGASHQHQTMRFAGALVGGFGIGMGAQIFILPHLDSIAGFTVLFIVVSALAGWIATSSPRLSYFGVQIALAFFLIHLSEFKIQTSLAVARDRVLGILLGLSMMWVAFDRLWAVRAGAEMKKAWIDTLRLLAQFAGGPVSKDPEIAIPRGLALHETINSQFGKVKSFADGVLFEFGPTRQQDLALRGRIRRWIPPLQAFFAMRTTLVKYRLQLPGFELPEAVQRAQEEFDSQLARRLDRMADRFAGGTPTGQDELESAFARLEETVGMSAAHVGQANAAASLQTFLPLCQMTEGVVASLEAELGR